MATDSIELSVPLPRSLDTRIYLRLSTKAKSIVLFLTTATQDELSTPVPLGSFVYALPNLPVYVTNSMSFANAGMGGTVEEEMEAFKSIVQVVSEKLQLSGAKPATV
ncbi:20s proteasome chaperone domain-containing [Fusarium sporotrichioides]|uniref:20s proteasome chaperone domain-containing n=1 Tax=Fusarium sporotrichioides TaxID=5514 RepID=A0A395RWB3_FUSSP|nr:20s proteasome chaperone domain-containing [Fusarium sporotrichioides]